VDPMLEARVPLEGKRRGRKPKRLSATGAGVTP
jgi:hypothetical protein